MSDIYVTKENEECRINILGVEVEFVGSKQETIILKERILEIIEEYKLKNVN